MGLLPIPNGRFMAYKIAVTKHRLTIPGMILPEGGNVGWFRGKLQVEMWDSFENFQHEKK